ncbi:MAG: hypothetical protein ACOYJD_06795 [Christensenellales bacterium]|jgi:hypothetical protein
MGKYAHLFHEPMTFEDARIVFFREVTKENVNELKRDYEAYATPAFHRELQYAFDHPEWIIK